MGNCALPLKSNILLMAAWFLILKLARIVYGLQSHVVFYILVAELVTELLAELLAE